MKTIKVMATTYDIRNLYSRAKSPAQRALLGYMVKTGEMSNPIFGGAFHILRNIEWCVGYGEIYNLFPIENTTIVTQIVDIAQSALDGKFDSFAFSAKEINNILQYIEKV